jgi:hypothetical protein
MDFPMGRKQTNVPTESLRWSIDAIEKECAITRKTMLRRFSESEILPSPDDGLYSTQQLLTALAGGDIRIQRLRRTTAQAIEIELKNAATERRLIPAAELHSALEKVFYVMRSHILGSGLPTHLTHTLLQNLSEIEVPK